MDKPIKLGTRVGFDYGDKRIGVATSDTQLIKTFYDRPIYLVDERLSTVNSNSKLREIGISEREGKAIIDQIAAIGILESALANEKSNRTIGDLI